MTGTLPWMLTVVNEEAGKMDDESRPEKPPKNYKFVISGVSKEITENEIESAAKCKEATRISKLIDKNPLKRKLSY